MTTAAARQPTAAPGVVLDVRGLKVYYHTRRGAVKAVDGVSFTLRRGERLALVGESGSGKTTTGLALMGAIRPPGRIEGGEAFLDGDDLLTLPDDEWRQRRLAKIAMIPQGAMNSLNPVVRVRHQIVDGLKDHGVKDTKEGYEARVDELLRSVELSPRVADAYPHELSGGMKQRVTMAIAISLSPKVIIADEPTSALDVVVQRQVVRTLQEVQEKIGAAAVLIGHDMGLMAQFADRVAIMYGGKLVEIGPVRDLFRDPKHPYTKLLISSLPDTMRKRKLEGIPGLPPSLIDPPSGCVFHPRCPQAFDRCRVDVPALRELAPGQVVACHLYDSPEPAAASSLAARAEART